jgi:hypothetical protein
MVVDGDLGRDIGSGVPGSFRAGDDAVAFRHRRPPGAHAGPDNFLQRPTPEGGEMTEVQQRSEVPEPESPDTDDDEDLSDGGWDR